MTRLTWMVVPLLVGCADGSREATSVGGVLARLVEASVPDQLRGPTVPTQPTIEGLYLGELEIVAYDYRPGEAVQSEQFAFAPGGDWSHDVVVQSGHPDARDVLLQSSSTVDFDDLNGGYRSPIPEAYVNAVGTFEVDLFEVNLYRTGMLVDGSYYGMNAELNGSKLHPLHRYPPLDTVPDYYANTVFAGFPAVDQTVNVFFARDDWFPTPVLVQVASNGGGDPYTVAWSSRALSKQEDTVLTSLATQGTQRRFYSNMVIVPITAPAALDLTAGDTLQVDVVFDFVGAVDFKATDLAAIAKDDSNSAELVYTADADGIPFSLDVTIQ